VAWRIDVALEMVRRGDAAAAIFYLRFCAYAISRIPMVHARSGEGRIVSFLRPEVAVLPELQRLVPEILGDLSDVLGGARTLDRDAVTSSLSMLNVFRDNTLAYLRNCGMPVSESTAWVPYRAPAAQLQGEELCRT
jgi:hypothetical protein